MCSVKHIYIYRVAFLIKYFSKALNVGNCLIIDMFMPVHSISYDEQREDTTETV